MYMGYGCGLYEGAVQKRSAYPVQILCQSTANACLGCEIMITGQPLVQWVSASGTGTGGCLSNMEKIVCAWLSLLYTSPVAIRHRIFA